MMIEDELSLWERYEAARKGLILHYLPLVERLAKFIARSTGLAQWEDLRQDGVIGLMKAITRFDPSRGVPFKAFARNYIRGAIFDSSDLTRDLGRRQDATYRKIKQAEGKVMEILQRSPTIEEVAKETQLTIEEIQSALDARSIAFAEGFPDDEDPLPLVTVYSPQPDRTILLQEALSQLSEIEQAIVRLHFLENEPYEEIAEKLEIIPIEVTKIRQRAGARVKKIYQRAIKKLNQQFGEKKKGGHHENR